MSMTEQDRTWMAKREDLTEDKRKLVDSVVDNIEDTLKEGGHPTPGDDRLAHLEAAVIRYIIESAE